MLWLDLLAMSASSVQWPRLRGATADGTGREIYVPSVFISTLSGVQDDSPTTVLEVHLAQHAYVDLPELCWQVYDMWCNGLQQVWRRRYAQAEPVPMPEVSLSSLRMWSSTAT